jgi:iron complex outermembrane receptor protein
MANLIDQKAASRDWAANAARQAMFGRRAGELNILRRVDVHSVTGIALSFVVAPALAAELQVADLASLSLEQLANIEVTSVSRRAERLADAPASIYVITGEDIRRAGVTSLPEALRLAPNLQVARTNANNYAISARGFNNSVGNKLLVLIDGRTVYTPLFSGVFWNAQEVMLEDVERIEVISGPGATLWGANAVNGVINVITRTARDTQGGLLAAGAGNHENAGAFRYGGKLGANGHYRVYGRGFEQQNTERANGTPVADGWNKGQAGFRADWGGTDRNFTLQGDLYSGDLEQVAPGKTRLEGANLLGRWNEQLAGGSNLRVQTYYDRTVRDQPGLFQEEIDTLDVEFQHALAPLGAHRLLWGGGYRHTRDHVQSSAVLAFVPGDKMLNWANVFVQDEIALREGLDLTVGAKVETNSYTGAEFLPSVRLAWKLSANRLVWGALSRAVRAPARLDRDLFIPGAPPFQFAGGPNFRSEISKVVEIGYRAQPVSTLSYSVSAFHHRHDHQRSLELMPGGSIEFGNQIEGTTNGLEAWGTYRVTKPWRLSAGLMALKQDLRRKPGSTDIGGVNALGNDPNHQWLLRSTLDLTSRHEFDVSVRHVGGLPNPSVPAYTAVDVRLGWHASRDVELALTLQNLFDSGHPEFGMAATRSEFDRAFFLKLLWRM